MVNLLLIKKIKYIMGLFNFFKKNKSINNTELNQFAKKMSENIFPNGQKDIDERTDTLLRILNNKVDIQTAKTIIMRSSSICYTSNLRGEFDIERLRLHLAGYSLQYFDDKSLQDFYILLVDTVLKPKELDWVSMMPKEYVQFMLPSIKSNPQATVTDEIYGTVGEFGLEPSNPVPVYGVPNNEVYLRRLRTLDGMPVKWERVGSTRHKDINMPIDDYDIFNSKGKLIANIYISPYHLHTSQKAPKGFKIII
jgi:hypothetical protein